MVYVGIDLHRKRSQVAALDQDGVQLFSRRIVNDPQIFLNLLQELGDDAQVALEATYGGSGWPICSRKRATSSTSRTRCARRRSPPRG